MILNYSLITHSPFNLAKNAENVMESPRYSRTNKVIPTQLTAPNTNSMTMETIGFLMIADKIKYNIRKIIMEIYLFADCLGTLKNLP